MARSLQDYLGTEAVLKEKTLTINLQELKAQIDPSDNGVVQNYSDDQAIAILVAALHANAKQKTENNIPIIDSEQALVASESFNPKTFEVRGEQAQVKHEFNFAIYTIDSTAFDPDNVV